MSRPPRRVSLPHLTSYRSQELKDLYVKWYQKHNVNHTFIPFDGRSDYDGFIRNGIPGGGIATGAEGEKTKEEAAMFGGVAGDWYDPCYHQLCDDVGNVNLTAWEINTKVSNLSYLFWFGRWLTYPVYSSSPTPSPLTPCPSRASQRERRARPRLLRMRTRPSIMATS